MRLQSLCCAALSLALPAVLRAQSEIKPVQAKPVEPYTAKTLEPTKSKEVSPYTASSSDSTRPNAARSRAGQVIDDVKDLPAPVAPPPVRRANLKAFVGRWQLLVEGASYTTDDYAAGTRTVTSSSGARGRRLVIRANGTYDWGGIRGRWVATGEGADGYPLKLLKADHGEDWKIGWDTRRNAPAGRILVWDGSVWEVGIRR